MNPIKELRKIADDLQSITAASKINPNDPPTEESFKILQKAAGPNTVVYEGYNNCKEYIQFSFHPDAIKTNLDLAQDLLETEGISTGPGGDVYTVKDGWTEESIDPNNSTNGRLWKWFIGFKNRYDEMKKKYEEILGVSLS